MSEVTMGEIMSKLHSIQSELRELRRTVESQRRADAPEEVTVLDDPDRGVFLPGTGWTGVQSPAEVEWDDETRSVKVTR